jgi:hypothetical protein
MTSKTFLTTSIGACLICMAPHAAMADAPDKLALPFDGRVFDATNIAFSADGTRICITGADVNDMGKSTVRLALINRTRRTVEWQKKVPLPDGLALLDPVQCVVGADRVYLLANGETSASPALARSRAYVFAFDLPGNRIASVPLDIPARSVYGYRIGETPAGLKVAGYVRDQDEEIERYGTYTVTLGPTLTAHGAPLMRKNGAYVLPPGARIVGDSLYLIGRFFPGTVKNTDAGEYMASRLRMDGGYIWSTRAPSMRLGVSAVVGDDGTNYSVGYMGDKTILAVVTPDGKVSSPLTYPSRYCRSHALAPYAGNLLAVRERCDAKDRALVSIDATTGQEHAVKTVPDEPLHVATKGSLWAVLARDKSGHAFLYSGENGAL